MYYDIAIVGGGTAGWLSAAYLSFKNPDKTICLVESPDIPTIGVGEGTFPTTMSLLRSIGIDPIELIVKSNGGLKLGIEYTNFSDKKFWLTTEPNWNKYGSQLIKDVGYSNKSPIVTPTDFFGCHFVATDLVEILKEHSVNRGVRHIVDNVLGSVVAGNRCSVISLGADKQIRAGWFLDCSGFARILAKKTDATFVNYDNSLLVDSAVVGQLPYKDKKTEFVPYTKIIAREAGWQFKIPTFNRTGNGYVYSSKFIGQADAEKTLREATGVETVKHLKMQLGYYDQLVIGNIVLVGLAGGFIEPMEATAIHITEQTLQQFQRLLAGETDSNAANHYMANKIKYIKTLILAHYAFSERTDPFWIEAKEKASQSVEIKEFFSNLKNGQYPTLDDTLDIAYPYGQWNELLKGFNQPHYYPHINSEAKKDIFLATHYLPNHLEYITHLRTQNG